jgi:hypothetical protein
MFPEQAASALAPGHDITERRLATRQQCLQLSNYFTSRYRVNQGCGTISHAHLVGRRPAIHGFAEASNAITDRYELPPATAGPA